MGQIRTYKYRLKDRRAKKLLRPKAIAVNQVWNWCTAQQRDVQRRYQAGTKRKWATHFDLTRECRGLGKMIGLHQQTVQNVCQEFTESRDQHRRAPNFRSSYGNKRARGWIPFQKQSRRIDGNSITYLGQKYRWFGNKRRPLPENAKGGVFIEDSQGRWWVCFHVEVETPVVKSTKQVGIDLGLKSFATLSNGTVIENPRHFRHLEGKLAQAQRARKKTRVRAIHTRIANSRRDFLHKLSTRLARDYAFIAVGNVNSKRLMQTPMAKSVSDVSWSTFRDMLKYKSLGYREIDENYSTQTCSSCLTRSGPKGIIGLGIRIWVCSNCNTFHDRDVNAAQNILGFALSVERPVGGSRSFLEESVDG